MMRANAIKHTKDVLIKYLRGYLKNPENYSYLCEGRDYSNSLIFDTDPNELRKFPMIVISGESGQLVTGGLGDFNSEIRDNTGALVAYRYGGMYDISLQVDIGTRTTKDRELLADLIGLAYRVYLRRFMQKEGVLVKDMRYSGESEVVYDSDKIYVASIQLSIWSEWYQDIDLLDVTGVKLNMEEQ